MRMSVHTHTHTHTHTHWETRLEGQVDFLGNEMTAKKRTEE